MPRTTCACVSKDPYECWRVRFKIHIFKDRQREIEEADGPCVCMCHEDWWGEQVNNVDVCHCNDPRIASKDFCLVCGKDLR